MSYAQGTSVTIARTRNEIEVTLARYGAVGFAYATEAERSVIMFDAHDRRIRLELKMPDRGDKRFTHTQTGRARPPLQARAAWEAGCWQRWRALLLVIKAKLEAVESEIVTFETEWLAYTVLPDGRTVDQWVGSQIAEAYAAGTMPALLAGPS